MPNENQPQPKPIFAAPPAPVPAQGGKTPVVSENSSSVQNVTAPEIKTKKKLPLIILAGLLLVGILATLFFVLKDKFIGKDNSVVSLTYWGLWEDEQVIKSLISEYEAVNPNVKINYVKQSQKDYRERLSSALAKEGGPDIFRFHNTWVPMFRKDLDYIPASIMTATDFAQTFYPVASSDLISGTGIVGIPLMYEGLTLFVNEDIFNEAQKGYPQTWDELRQVAKELTIKNEEGEIIRAGVALGRTENVDGWQEILALMMIQNGVNLNSPTGKLAEDALTFYTMFSKVDGVWDATLPPSTTYFASGNLAMYFGPSWRVFEIKAQNPNLKFKSIPLPQLAKEDPVEPDISLASYWVEGVWVKSSTKQEAWDFLKFLSTKESLQKFYQAASKVRAFGEPYSRVDMAIAIGADPYVGSLIKQAPQARSWYLVSRTWDGPTGINTLISKYFEDAVNAVNQGEVAAEALEPAAAGVAQVLTQYGLATK